MKWAIKEFCEAELYLIDNDSIWLRGEESQRQGARGAYLDILYFISLVEGACQLPDTISVGHTNPLDYTVYRIEEPR